MRVMAIVGSYRKGGVIDMAVDEILSAARASGAETEKVYLIDRRIEFCTNCRTCTQREGPNRGQCPLDDELRDILDAAERSDALVVGSPMNFWTVTAVTKRFIERLVCYAWWPWGMAAPKGRTSRRPRRAVVVASSAAPALMGRYFTRMVGLMKTTAELLGAKVVGVLFIGLAAGEQHPVLSESTRRRARRLGARLAAAAQAARG